MLWCDERDLEPKLTQTLKRKTKTKQIKQTRDVDMQCRVCASVDCVKQVGVVLCHCGPVLGRLLWKCNTLQITSYPT